MLLGKNNFKFGDILSESDEGDVRHGMYVGPFTLEGSGRYVYHRLIDSQGEEYILNEDDEVTFQYNVKDEYHELFDNCYA
jgi:hypothetical protein